MFNKKKYTILTSWKSGKSRESWSRRRKGAHQSGMTILELVVAMAIAGTVISLVLGSYLNITKGFYLQVNKSAQILQMAALKKQIDKNIGAVGVVISVRETALDYQDKEAGALHTMSFGNAMLKKDSLIVAGHLEKFAWSLLQPSTGPGKAVLYWEAYIGNGWIGGATEVAKQ